MSAQTTASLGLPQRIDDCDWPQIEADLDARGFARIDSLLTAAECRDVIAMYEEPRGFRSRVVMTRHGFGRGEYRYFAYPLPDLVQQIRWHAYPHLALLANRWAERMRQERRFPRTLEAFRAECHEAGQERPTALLLKYGEGDYNCLHQDVYGEITFPIQLAILLNEPGQDFSGGELVLTEQRPRMQSRVEVVPLRRGDAVLFAVHHRPMQGVRGTYRVTMRHGVSRLRGGERFTLGVIFHDAT